MTNPVCLLYTVIHNPAQLSTAQAYFYHAKHALCYNAACARRHTRDDQTPIHSARDRAVDPIRHWHKRRVGAGRAGRQVPRRPGQRDLRTNRIAGQGRLLAGPAPFFFHKRAEETVSLCQVPMSRTEPGALSSLRYGFPPGNSQPNSCEFGTPSSRRGT